MTMSLVRRRNYGVICRCSAVPMLVWERGVGFSFFSFFFLNLESSGRVTIGLFPLKEG